MHGINLQQPGIAGAPRIESQDLIDAAREVTADVLAVQEIDQFQLRSSNIDQAQLISEITKLPNYRFVPTVLGNPDEGKKSWQAAAEVELDLANTAMEPRYGIGLFTRYPVKSWYQLDLPGAKITTPIAIPDQNGKPRLIWISDEPRVVLAAELDTEIGSILVATTHLSFVPGRNLRQLRTTLRWLAQFELPKIFLGDLNLPATAIKLVTSWHRTPTTPTFPINNPKAQFDHILTTKELMISNPSTKKMLVGDHLAISAVIGQSL